jgi:hypothetical protein
MLSSIFLKRILPSFLPVSAFKHNPSNEFLLLLDDFSHMAFTTTRWNVSNKVFVQALNIGTATEREKKI